MRRLFAPFTRVLLLVSCVAAISVGALAQSQANSGNIEGRVVDPNGAAVAGATVTATNQQTGLEKSATRSDDGLFRIILLPPGTYTVKTSASGFSPSAVKDVTRTAGSHTPVDLKPTV